jgi:tRNA(Ile)-lysidine synthase
VTLADRALKTVRKYDLVPPGGRVAAAVSGGPDSVALALLLRELEQRGELTLAGIAHLNHGLRGEAADADERFCSALAEELGVSIHVERANVRALAAAERTSLEDAGRRARRAFFGRAASRLDAARVAVGQTRDDQAETFLLRLFRGAGTAGLAGIQPRADLVVRPLLEIGRAELREYLDARGQPSCQDETNFDLDIPRNRIRHELLPYLERHFSPGIVRVLAREAGLARADGQWLDRAAIETAPSIVLSTDGGTEVDARALCQLPEALAGRVARIALARQAGQRFIGFEQVEALLALAHEVRGARQSVDLPGQRAIRTGDRILLSAQAARGEPAGGSVNTFRYPLSIPGEVVLDELGWVISAETFERHASPVDGGVPRRDAAGPESEDLTAPITKLSARGDCTAVAAKGLHGPLAVRNRRPGDVFRPLGLAGHKKLQDFFVDRKVPRVLRDRVPLVVDANDRIVWVVGHTVAEDFRVTEPSQAVILLKARRLGGQG